MYLITHYLERYHTTYMVHNIVIIVFDTLQLIEKLFIFIFNECKEELRKKIVKFLTKRSSKALVLYDVRP